MILRLVTSGPDDDELEEDPEASAGAAGGSALRLFRPDRRTGSAVVG